MECPKCKGKGKTRIGLKRFPRSCKCPHCDGTGEIDKYHVWMCSHNYSSYPFVRDTNGWYDSATYWHDDDSDCPMPMYRLQKVG